MVRPTKIYKNLLRGQLQQTVDDYHGQKNMKSRARLKMRLDFHKKVMVAEAELYPTEVKNVGREFSSVAWEKLMEQNRKEVKEAFESLLDSTQYGGSVNWQDRQVLGRLKIPLLDAIMARVDKAAEDQHHNNSSPRSLRDRLEAIGKIGDIRKQVLEKPKKRKNQEPEQDSQGAKRKRKFLSPF